MTDADIVTLYWARDEQAIAQTAQKFCGMLFQAAIQVSFSHSSASSWLPSKMCIRDSNNAD